MTTTFEKKVYDVKEYCYNNDLMPLFVADTGSRAWGFATETSDYDPKFVFTYKDKNKYLSLGEPALHCKFQSLDGDETVGYDVRHFLGMLKKGNAQCWEMVGSDLLSDLNPFKTAELTSLVVRHLHDNLSKVFAHYFGVAHSRLKSPGETNHEKRLVHVVRALLAARYVQTRKALPPLTYSELASLVYEFESDFFLTEEVYNAFQTFVKTRSPYNTVLVEEWAKQRLEEFRQVLNDAKDDQSGEGHPYFETKYLTTNADFDELYRTLTDLNLYTK